MMVDKEGDSKKRPKSANPDSPSKTRAKAKSKMTKEELSNALINLEQKAKQPPAPEPKQTPAPKAKQTPAPKAKQPPAPKAKQPPPPEPKQTPAPKAKQTTASEAKQTPASNAKTVKKDTKQKPEHNINKDTSVDPDYWRKRPVGYLITQLEAFYGVRLTMAQKKRKNKLTPPQLAAMMIEILKI